MGIKPAGAGSTADSSAPCQERCWRCGAVRSINGARRRARALRTRTCGWSCCSLYEDLKSKDRMLESCFKQLNFQLFLWFQPFSRENKIKIFFISGCFYSPTFSPAFLFGLEVVLGVSAMSLLRTEPTVGRKALRKWGGWGGHPLFSMQLIFVGSGGAGVLGSSQGSSCHDAFAMSVW